jgi:hypothetical protein
VAVYCWITLVPGLRYGRSSSSTSILLYRDGSGHFAILFFESKRKTAGLLAWEEISMVLRPHPHKGASEDLPFQIKQGDIITVLHPLWDEHRSLTRSRRTWQDTTTPVRSIEGTHMVPAAVLRGAESLRPAAWIVLIVFSSVGLLTAVGLTARISRRLRRFKRGLCPMCAYPLPAAIDGAAICPECGTRHT